MTRTENAGVSMGTSRGGDREPAPAPASSSASTPTARRPHGRGTHTLYPALRRGWTDDVYAEQTGCGHGPGRSSARSASPTAASRERSDFTGFNWSNVPAILVEMGFMTNPTDDRLLAKGAYQRRAALGLCRGTLRLGSTAGRAAAEESQSTATTSTGSSKPLSFSVRGSETRNAARAVDGLAADEDLAAAGAAPTRAAMCTPCPP